MVRELSYDIVIVGAGPAGSSAAFAAAKLGHRVALLEREEAVAQTVRTSGVTWMDSIREFEIPESCYNPVKNYGFCSPNNEVVISSDTPMAAVLDVRKTYRWLAEKAQKQEAELYINTTVTEASRDSNGITLNTTSNKEEIIFHAKIVIDASGFQTIVAKALGLVTQWKRFGAGAEYEVEVENADSDTWWLMVGQDYSPAGYAWIFPLGGNIVRIGVGVGKPESPVDPTIRLEEIIEKKLGPISKLGKIRQIEFHYGLIPNDGLSRKTVYDNLILVGDTAGMANPLVLEGIRYAIRFGRIAGETAANALLRGNLSEKALMSYEENWKKAIQSKINSASKVQSRWIGLSDEQWDKELDVIKELSIDEFLDFIKADFSIGSIVKLALNHPKLAVRQLFTIVRGSK
ncbi:MAG: NAD(P)/FAD-dependent oxidoreductase [Nitrososphaeria archaeon]|nr:NAD(P)/FAD-dependent oxidoreductase [Nitrososphaeria archaeon]NDB50767.1 NAD(P)/FAD-dependent oxidoreductase [Nitrosopumilaceae archaeon]NDB89420.1 NAD(P)/FAD-dependent oxidoreductase [Nitrososphaerota archaeon]NDF26912.1 NAD(P)/FAD-dependent oxidoreductase [Nitrosopumilaceae archaeon]NDF29007.1 NAD(P)/FAD-dependent oxidoreductase [Nitrososphaeria archaeon]